MLPDIGLSEILVIALAAVLLVKPEEIPGIMRKAGMLFAYGQRYVYGMWQGWKEKAGI